MAEEKLIGDVAESLLHSVKAHRIAGAVEKITGKPCNCGQRKMKLNEIHRKLRNAAARRNERIRQATEDR